MPTKSFDVEVADNTKIVDLRGEVAKQVQKEPAQLVLIFGGKILKDEDTLDTHNIKDNNSVHLVIKNQRQESSQPKPEQSTPAATTPTSQPSSQPSGGSSASSNQPSSNPFAALGGSQAMGNMLRGMQGSGNMSEMQQQMMNNPELMNQLMSSPHVQNAMQGLLDNPELLQQMIRLNPQMNQIMEQNPEIAHMFNNPALLRQVMEMQRNPSMMQEMMRNQDRAMTNIENMPGGFHALERMFRDVQEPMMNATARPNQYQSNNEDGNNSSTSDQAGRQNTEALPNPWGGGGTNQPASNTTGNSNTTGSNSSGGNSANPFASLGSGLGGLGGGGLGAMNPEMMRGTMDMLRQNPELMRSMLNTMNPQLANNPRMQEMLTNALPEMTNPTVIQALDQINQGYETLRREAPRFWESMGMPAGGMPGPGGMPGMDNNMRQMMQQMGGLGGLSNQTGNQTVTPAPDAETRFASQLEQLEMMGFTNKTANIEELTRTGGNVEAAVDRLLNRPR